MEEIGKHQKVVLDYSCEKIPLKLPKRALFSHELEECDKQLRIPFFLEVLTLPQQTFKSESTIVNLDLNENNGTHW